MECLLKQIKQVVSEQKDIFTSETVVEELTELVGNFELSRADWEKFVHFDEFRYTRNLVSLDESDRFGLMILAWGPGQKSPIHDHNGSHCIMRILEGNLVETLYNRRGQSGTESDTSFDPSNDVDYYEKTGEKLLETGQTAYIHDRIGWHRVSNPSEMEPSVSLHLYAPTIEKCRTYCEIEGRVRSQAACPYYSINGRKVHF